MKACELASAVLMSGKPQTTLEKTAYALAEIVQTMDRDYLVLMDATKKDKKVLKWIKDTRKRCDDIATQMRW